MPKRAPFVFALALCAPAVLAQATTQPRFPDVLPNHLFDRTDLVKLLSARMSEHAAGGAPASVDDELLRARADPTITLVSYLLGAKGFLVMGRTPTFPDWSRSRVSAADLGGCFKLPASSVAAGALRPRRAPLENAQRIVQARGSEAKLPEVRTMLQDYDAHVTALVARIDANDRDGAQAAVLAYRDWVIALPSAGVETPAQLAREAAPASAKPRPAPATTRETTPRALPLPDFASDPVRLRLLSLQLRLESSAANGADPLRRSRLAIATAFVTHCTHLRLTLQDTDAGLEAMQRTEEGLRLAGLDEQAAADAGRIEELRRSRLRATSCRTFIETAIRGPDEYFALLRIDPAPALVETTCRELGVLGQWLIGLTTNPGDAAMQAECRRLAAGVGEVVRALRAGKAEDAVRVADALWDEALAPLASFTSRQSAPFPLPDAPRPVRQPRDTGSASQVAWAMASAADRFWGTLDGVAGQLREARRHVEAARKQAGLDPRQTPSLRRSEEMLVAHETFTRLELADRLQGEGLTAFFADLVGGQPPAHVAQQLAAFRERFPQIEASSRDAGDRALVQLWIERAKKIEDLLADRDLEQAQRLLDAAWADVMIPR